MLAIFCWTFAAAVLHFLLWDQYSCLGLPRADAVDASGSVGEVIGVSIAVLDSPDVA